MDLTQRAISFRSFHRAALSWILSNGWPRSVVIAMGSQQRLLLMQNQLMLLHLLLPLQHLLLQQKLLRSNF